MMVEIFRVDLKIFMDCFVCIEVEYGQGREKVFFWLVSRQCGIFILVSCILLCEFGEILRDLDLCFRVVFVVVL